MHVQHRELRKWGKNKEQNNDQKYHQYPLTFFLCVCVCLCVFVCVCIYVFPLFIYLFTLI